MKYKKKYFFFLRPFLLITMLSLVGFSCGGNGGSLEKSGWIVNSMKKLLNVNDEIVNAQILAEIENELKDAVNAASEGGLDTFDEKMLLKVFKNLPGGTAFGSGDEIWAKKLCDDFIYTDTKEDVIEGIMNLFFKEEEEA